MAFIPVLPLRPARPAQRASPTRISIHASAQRQPPPDFKAPTPRKFRVRPDKTLDIAAASAGTLLRSYSGALVAGYRVRIEDNKVIEYSSSLPSTKPKIPLRFFEYEQCPFCRKVREAVSMLDLDVLIFPCPVNGTLYRSYIVQKGGKAQFPYMEDPNADWAGYESGDIIRHLYRTYGPSNGRVPAVLGGGSLVTAKLSSMLRPGKGSRKIKGAYTPEKALILWGYEASPFVKLVRETLCELEIPYLYMSTARGSSTRAVMKERFGRFQVPYLQDCNTGIEMYESAEICEYLRATYGEGGDGEVGNPFMPGMDAPQFEIGDIEVKAKETNEVQENKVDKSLNPQQGKDEALEKYCEDNPESDECRIYEN